MDAQERRAEKRVCPPGDTVLDFALWPAEVVSPYRLPVQALGPPLACRAAGDRLVLADITAIGLGLCLCTAPDTSERLAASPALFLYLKLHDYRPLAPTNALSLFFLAQMARATLHPATLAMGLRFLRQGRGSSYEKALELLDISRFGVAELVTWIDALARHIDQPNRAPSPGLDLDRLLDEPELGRMPPEGKRIGP